MGELIPFPVKEKEELSELEKIVPDVGDGWKEIISNMDLDDATKTGKMYIDGVKRDIERVYQHIQFSKGVINHMEDPFSIVETSVQTAFYTLRVYYLLMERERTLRKGD